MNCKTYKTKIDEQILNAEVLSHLEACADCRTFREERECLLKLVEKLERINAPANFEFGVRAKLQTVKPVAKDWRRRFAYAAPAVAVAAFVVYGVSNVSVFTPPVTDDKAAAVQATPQTTPESAFVGQPMPSNPQPSLIETVDSGKNPTSPVPSEILSANNPGNTRSVAAPNKRQNEKKRDRGEIIVRDIDEPVGSVELGLESPAPPKMPKGIDPVAPKTTTRTVLDFHGIGISENDWTVKSILPNSSAAGSGIMVGDSIETINGQKAATTALKGVEKEIVLEVMRGGKLQKIVVVTKPNPQK